MRADLSDQSTFIPDFLRSDQRQMLKNSQTRINSLKRKCETLEQETHFLRGSLKISMCAIAILIAAVVILMVNKPPIFAG